LNRPAFAVLLAAGVTIASAQTAIPTFHCLSLYWDPPDGAANVACNVEYRAAGETAWRKGLDLWYAGDVLGDAWDSQYRGSLVGLKPGTGYEVRLTLPSGASSTVAARTWSEAFKVKKTIMVAGGGSMLTTSEGGSEQDGYVVYDGTGATIDVNNGADQCVLVNHDYVIIRGLALKRGKIHGVNVNGKNHVVVEGCDISGWGQLRDTYNGVDYGKSYNAGVYLPAASKTVVIQGNKIHHPRYQSNVWNLIPTQAHPEGPGAITGPSNTSGSAVVQGNYVIRYNDIYSDDNHLFHDCMHSGANFTTEGFPGPDCDIYCNMLSHSADDAIEADGGGRNVRIWGNYSSHVFLHISVAPASVGPVYVFRNVLNRNLNPLSPSLWTCFKRGGRNGTEKGRAYFIHNTALRDDQYGANNMMQSGNYDAPLIEVISRNNLIITRNYSIEGSTEGCVNSSFDYDFLNKPMHGNVPAGSETHGIIGKAPQWRSGHGPSAEDGGRYQLAQGSPGHDDGVALDNFNDGFEGSAPDMGAQEYDSPDMKFGTAAWDGPKALTAPKGLSYATNPATYEIGVDIGSNVVSVTGEVDSFTVSPPLPEGLTLDKTAGTVTGTPAGAAAQAGYAVTAFNGAGSCTVLLTITVHGPASAARAVAGRLERAPDEETVSLYGLNGRLVRRVNATAMKRLSPGPAIPAGLYIMAVDRNGASVQSRIVIPENGRR